MFSYLSSVYDYVDYSISDIYNWIGDHTEGHLPKISGAEKMKNALDILGISNDYEVIKPIIWAADKKSVVVEYKKQ